MFRRHQSSHKNPRYLLIFFLVLTILLLPSIYFLSRNPDTAEASWYDGSWGYRKKITIDADKVSGSGDLSDFPMLFDRTMADLASFAQPDGDDILFTSADGMTKLSHEIESYDSATGRLIAWIKIPTLSATNDTTLYIYYGNNSASNQQDVTNVWTSNHKAVYHLKEATNGTAPQLYDSTSYSHDLTSEGNMATTDTSTTGQVGDAVAFNGSNDRAGTPRTADLDLDNSYTLSIWMYRTGSGQSSTSLLVGKFHNSQGDDHDYALGLNSSNLIRFRTNAFSFGSAELFSNSTIPLNTWTHVVGTYDGSTARIYINGVEDNNKAHTQGTKSNQTFPIYIGGANTNRMYTGRLDRVKIIDDVMSEHWIATDYNSTGLNSSFFTLGNTETQSSQAVLALNFDELTGSIAYDSGPNQYNGTISGATRQYQSMCLEDGCYLFDGTDDVITVTNAGGIDLDAGLAEGFTIAAWVKPLSDGESNVGQIFQKGTDTYCRTDSESAGKVDLECSLDLATTNATLNIAGALTLSRWHHVAMTYEDDGDDEISIYIDGKLAGTSTNGDGAPASDANNLLIGGSTSANFHGFIDNFLIFDHAKDAAGIAGISILGATNNQTSASLGGNPDWEIGNNLLAYWPLDSISSITPDLSGSGYTLDRYNTVTSVTGKFDTGSEHVPASSQYFGTSATIPGVKSVSFWTNPDSTTNYYVSLTSGAYITSTSGTLSATGFTNPRIYVNGQESSTIAANSWQHVVVTSDTTIDANQFYLGREGANYYDGTLDDVRLYSTQLDSRFVRMLYDWGPPPLMYWNFDENTGTTTVNDRVGPTLSDMALTNVTQGDWVSGKYGSALKFNGSSSYGSISTGIPDMNINQGTVSTWFKLTGDLSSEALVFNHYHVNGTDTRIRILLTSAELISVRLGSGSNVSTGITAALNTWYHVALVWDNGNYRAYVNGIQTNSGSYAGLTQTQCISVGAYNCPGGTNSYFNGVVDDMRLYTYAQTTEQVVRDMNGGHPAGGSPIGSQLSYWKFDEMQGQTVNSQTNNSSYAGTLGANTGVASDDPTWKSAQHCKFNGCLEFDGTQDFVTAPGSNSSQFSISMWIKPDAVVSRGIAGMAESPGSGSHDRDLYFDANSKIAGRIYNAGNYFVRSTTTAVAGNWYHLGLIHTGTQLQLWINGNLESSTTAPVPDSYTTPEFVIGQTYTGMGAPDTVIDYPYFDGHIDDVQYYTYPLSQEELAIVMNANSAVNLGTGSSLYTDSLSGAATAPVLHWSFDENTGTSSVQDFSGNGKSGTLNNFTGGEWVPGAKGSAVRLNGINQAIARADDNDLDFGSTQASTISLWFRTNTISAEEVLVNKYDGVGGTGGYRIRLSATGNPECLYDNDSTGWPSYVITSALDFDDNKWHHVVCQRSSAGLVYLFVDGRLMGIDTITTASLANAANFSVGFNGGGNYFPGEIDDVKVYRSVVPTDHLAIDRNGGKPVFHWTMNECSGTTINDTMGILNATLTVGGSGTITSAGNCETSGTSWYQSNTAPRGYAITLDGTDDKITTSAIPYVYGALVRTVGIWFYPTAAVDRTLIGWGSLANTQMFDLMQFDGEIIGEFYGSGNNTITADSPSYTLNTWQHAVMVYSGGTASIYYNGKFANSKSITLNTGNTTIEIGNSKNTSYDFYQGKLDDAKVWSYPLTAKQIEQEYLQGKAVRF